MGDCNMGKNNKRFSLPEAQQEFINKGYIPLFNEYINARKKLLAQTQEGYKIVTILNTVKSGHIPYVFGNTNPYTIENIKLWTKLNNKPFELLSEEYINAIDKLQWKCLKDNCGEIFEMTWDNIKHGEGCSYCRGFKVGISNCLEILNPELSKQWHPTKNGNLTPYDVTCGCNKKVWWICEKGHEWEATICSRNNGTGCPYCTCYLPSRDYNLLIINPNLCKEWDYNKNEKSPEEYTPNSGKKIWWECKKCKHKWEASIDNRSKGRGCPQCSKSKGETKIEEWLKNNNILFILQKEFDGLLGLGNGYLSYDFFLPDHNLLIEYQGQFHDGSTGEYSRINLKTQQEHDRRKKEHCKLNSIELLEIWYWDFDNIENILNGLIK